MLHTWNFISNKHRSYSCIPLKCLTLMMMVVFMIMFIIIIITTMTMALRHRYFFHFKFTNNTPEYNKSYLMLCIKATKDTHLMGPTICIQ